MPILSTASAGTDGLTIEDIFTHLLAVVHINGLLLNHIKDDRRVSFPRFGILAQRWVQNLAIDLRCSASDAWRSCSAPTLVSTQVQRPPLFHSTSFSASQLRSGRISSLPPSLEWPCLQAPPHLSATFVSKLSMAPRRSSASSIAVPTRLVTKSLIVSGLLYTGVGTLKKAASKTPPRWKSDAVNPARPSKETQIVFG